MTPELIQMLSDALIPVIAGIALYFFKQLLAFRDIELSDAGEEVARQKILAAIERAAGAYRSGESMPNFEDAVNYVEDRMRESLDILGMTTEEVEETLLIEVDRQTATATTL